MNLTWQKSESLVAPLALDTTLSKKAVYIRKNINVEEVENQTETVENTEEPKKEEKKFSRDDIAKMVPFKMDWNRKTIVFLNPEPEEVLHIVMYYDRDYINSLEIETNKYNESRIKATDKNVIPKNK